MIYAYAVGRNETANGSPRDDNSGIFLEIDAATGLATVITDDGIITHEINPTSTGTPPASQVTNNVPPRSGDGIQFNAMTFTDSFNRFGFAVGDRGANVPPNRPFGPTRFDNILYQFVQDQLDPQFGEPVSTPQSDRVDSDNPLDRLWDQAGTNIRERGELLTSPKILTEDATIQVVNTTTMEIETEFNIEDGTSITVVDRERETAFEYDFGFEVQQLVDGQDGVTIRDGNFFLLDDTLFQLDTGPVISVLSNGGLIRSGTIITVRDATGLQLNFELTTGDAVTAPNIAVAYATNSPPEAIVTSLATAINASALDVEAFTSPVSGRLTLVDPCADVNGQFGQVSVTGLSFGNSDQIDGTIPQPSQGIRIEGDNGEAPILQTGDGSTIDDGQTFQINTDSTNGSPVTFEFDGGHVLQIPRTYAIQVPLGGGRVINDEETFTIDANVNDAVPPVVFEFENTDLGNGLVTPGDVAIGINGRSSQDEVANLIVSVIGSAMGVPTLQPSNQGGGYVHLGASDIQELDTSNSVSLTELGGDAPIDDAQSFRIDLTGSTPISRIFEFDDDNSNTGAGSVIDASHDLTAEQIASNAVDAINNFPLGLTAVLLEDGKFAVHDPRIAADPFDVTNNVPRLDTISEPGVLQPPDYSTTCCRSILALIDI